MKFNDVFLIVFFLIGLGILVISVWNLRTLKSLSKSRAHKDSQLNDSKYFELKYKYEFLVSIFTLIIGVVSFIGYNSFETLKDDLTTYFKMKTDSTMNSIKIQQKSIDKLRGEIEVQTQKVFSTNDLIDIINKEQKNISNQISFDKRSSLEIQSKLNIVKEKLAAIQNKNILKQEIFIVEDLQYPLNGEWIPKIYYFKNLRSINNDSLPAFKKSPIVIPFSNDGFSYIVSQVTNNSFKLTAIGNSQSVELPQFGKLSLMISVTN